MRQILWIAALALCLVGCGPEPEDDRAVQDFFENVRLGQYEAIQDDLAANLKTAESTAQLEEVRRMYIPAEAPTKAARINWSRNQIYGGDTTASYIYRYDYADRVLVVTTSTRQAPGSPMLIEGFHVNVTPVSAEVAAAAEFSLLNKPPKQLAFFGVLICSVMLMILAFFGTIFTKGFKRKWLFAILAFFGFPVLLMNWTTGEWAAQFTLGLINTGVSRSLAPLDPWMVRFQIPIGALIVLSLLWPRWFGGYSEDESGPPS